jgi:hypothetical protein
MHAYRYTNNNMVNKPYKNHMHAYRYTNNNMVNKPYKDHMHAYRYTNNNMVINPTQTTCMSIGTKQRKALMEKELLLVMKISKNIRNY